jgi:ATP-dependent DNA ligase
LGKIIKSDFRFSQEWRDSLKFIDYNYDEFINFLSQSDKQYIYSEKLDGELNSLIYEKGKEPYFLTKSGVVHNRNYAVLKEYKNILDRINHINDIVIIGELKAFNQYENIPFNRSQSIIRTGDVDLVCHYPFDIYRLNGKKTNSDITILNETFLDNHIRTPRFIYGNVDKFKELWENIVIKEKGEGIVVIDPTNPNIRYRIKHTMTADVVVIGAGNENEKNWAKGKIGYLKLALLDENNNFLLTSKVGTGFSDKVRIELFKHVNKNEIEGKDGEILISPNIIIEVKYRRHRFVKTPLLHYSKNKYIVIGEGDGVMMDQTSFIRFRDDKRLNYQDLSIKQFPL